MKNFQIFFIILAVILVLAGYGYFRAVPAPANQAENLPKIQIAPESFDFGEIKYGDVVKYTFKVKNIGQETLEIKRVATSCSCTTAKVGADKIEPNQETDLLVRYDSGAMSGSHGRGLQERIIFIKSSDPLNPQIQVMTYADVK